VRTFSRGMQQRLSLARALLHEPQVLFLDEPFSGLDPHAMGMLQQTLSDLLRGGCGVLLVTHDLDRGVAVSDRWIVLDGGRLVEQGAAAAGDRERLEAVCSPRDVAPAPEKQ
jgi:ABC-type multidrug transport system ATPase subunit